MSDSYRKTPIFPINGSKSARFSKKRRSGQERRQVRDSIKRGLKNSDFDDLYELKYQLQYWDEWICERDGKSYLTLSMLKTIQRSYYLATGRKISYKQIMSK